MRFLMGQRRLYVIRNFAELFAELYIDRLLERIVGLKQPGPAREGGDDSACPGRYCWLSQAPWTLRLGLQLGLQLELCGMPTLCRSRA